MLTTISKVTGDFVSMGQIYIYRYERESGGNGGPQSVSTISMNDNRLQLCIQPNPIFKEFIVMYILPCEADVELTIYDAAGRIITTISEGRRLPGSYRKSVPSSDVPKGVYFIRLVAGNTAVVKKAVFLK